MDDLLKHMFGKEPRTFVITDVGLGKLGYMSLN